MKKILLPAMLLCFGTVTSCDKKEKVVAVPKPATLTVIKTDGTLLKLPVKADQDATLAISENDCMITITKADGTVQRIPLVMDPAIAPEVKQGIQKLIEEGRIWKVPQVGTLPCKSLTTNTPAKSGTWRDVAYYLQNGHKKNF